MKVRVEIGEQHQPPYAVIYTDRVTDDIQKMIDLLGANRAPILARAEDQKVFLQPEEIYMVRVEGGQTVIYTDKKVYFSCARLCEIRAQLGAGFLQISKQTLVNISCLQGLETGFSGALLLKLRNGLSDYVSRKYLPDFKKQLGL